MNTMNAPMKNTITGTTLVNIVNEIAVKSAQAIGKVDGVLQSNGNLTKIRNFKIIANFPIQCV